MLINTRRPFHPRSQMAGFWDDMMDTPTIYLDPIDESQVSDTVNYDTGIDGSVLDARDAWAQNGGAPIVSATNTGSSWSLSDILKTGTTIARELTQIQAVTLPNGSRIYARRDPATGQLVTGGRTVTVPSTGLSQFINQNLPMIALAGAALLIAMNGD